MPDTPRRMLEAGVEGDLLNEHAEGPTCAEQGCVPVDATPPPPPDTRLRDAAQAVVTAYRGVRSGLGFDTTLTRLSDAVQALEAVLREAHTNI